jgi:AcrR family transcriptional regulator
VATTDRILATAEQLFGTYGIEAVSMRQITIGSGASNNSAIAYHFGDRANLVREIWRRRLPALEVVRADMLREIVEAGRQDDPYALARALVLPAYGLADGDGRHRYAAFLRQALRWAEGRALRAEAMDLSPSSATGFAMFRRLFPHLSDDLFLWRSLAATGLFFDLVFDRDCDIAEGLPAMDEKIFLDEAVKLFVSCCAA